MKALFVRVSETTHANAKLCAGFRGISVNEWATLWIEAAIEQTLAEIRTTVGGPKLPDQPLPTKMPASEPEPPPKVEGGEQRKLLTNKPPYKGPAPKVHR